MNSTSFKNYRDHVGLGTSGYKPPEQVEARFKGGGRKRKERSLLPGELIGEKAMVFSIATIMFWVSLMHHT
jgi:hypothetical protein